MRQILVTRFNNKLNERYPFALDTEWLDFRWRLFTAITVPSVAGQSDNDFDWIVKCHAETPEWLKQQMRLIKLPCRVDFVFGSVGSVVKQFRSQSCGFILTSRLDSDDALHKKAMRLARRYAEANDFRCDVLNFELGYQLDLQSGLITPVRLESPPFNTKLHRSPFDRPLSLGGRHTALKARFDYVEISGGEPMFLQTIHGRNLANELLAGAFLPPDLSERTLLEKFNIHLSQVRTAAPCRTGEPSGSVGG